MRINPFLIVMLLVPSVICAACQTTGSTPRGPRTHEVGKPPASFRAATEPKIAVVLMHGKWGSPVGYVGPLVTELEAQGYWVVAPEMPWSGAREYDVSYEDAMQEIQSIVERQRAAGATHLFVGGHSQGATAALGYVARHPEVSGVLAIAPGHTPEAGGFMQKVARSTGKSYAMIKRGEGDKKAYFEDYNVDRVRSIYTTANIYESYFSVTGPANALENQHRLKTSVPQLWVLPEDDTSYAVTRAAMYLDRAPPHPRSRLVIVPGGHVEGPSKGLRAVVEFIQDVAGARR